MFDYIYMIFRLVDCEDVRITALFLRHSVQCGIAPPLLVEFDCSIAYLSHWDDQGSFDQFGISVRRRRGTIFVSKQLVMITTRGV